MYAVEFETSINNGVFRIPESFRKLQSVAKAKIIIMVEEDAVSTVPASLGFIEKLANNPLRVGNTLRFLSREEANER
jgi:hypothetical protein